MTRDELLSRLERMEKEKRDEVGEHESRGKAHGYASKRAAHDALDALALFQARAALAVGFKAADQMERMLRYRHDQAHNGDIVEAGPFETCSFCAETRELIAALRLPTPPAEEN